MVNTVTDHPCVYNSATGTLTIRGLGTIDFAALVEEFKSTGGVLDPGERIVLRPGQLRSLRSSPPSLTARRPNRIWPLAEFFMSASCRSFPPKIASNREKQGRFHASLLFL